MTGLGDEAKEELIAARDALVQGVEVDTDRLRQLIKASMLNLMNARDDRVRYRATATLAEITGMVTKAGAKPPPRGAEQTDDAFLAEAKKNLGVK